MNDESQQRKLEILKGSVTSDYDTMDYRFPEMYRASVPEGTRVVIEWFEAFSQRNLERMKELMLFPFVHVEENTLITIERRDDLLKRPPPFMDVHSIANKDYDALEGLGTLIFRPAEVGFFLNFGRYHPDGTRFLQGETFLRVQKDRVGQWGLQQSSTMLKPASEADVVHTETIEASRRILHLYMYSYGVKDQALLNQLGWPHGNVDYERFGKMAGSRIGDYHDTIGVKIEIPQHSDNKAHCLTTFIRRQRNGRPITINRGVYITAKQEGHWRWLIGGAYAREHDFSNDVGS